MWLPFLRLCLLTSLFQYKCRVSYLEVDIHLLCRRTLHQEDKTVHVLAHMCVSHHIAELHGCLIRTMSYMGSICINPLIQVLSAFRKLYNKYHFIIMWSCCYRCGSVYFYVCLYNSIICSQLKLGLRSTEKSNCASWKKILSLYIYNT